MEENNGCLNLVGFIAFIIALYIWVTNVETIKVVEQIPPPQDSWDVVYPKFRDEVSTQLLNTQRIAGSVLDETTYLKQQNAELQYSVDLLLNNLGILKKESYEESIRQRNEQRVTTVLSIILGWLLGAFVTKDSMNEIRKRFTNRKNKNPSRSLTYKPDEEKNDVNRSLARQTPKEPLPTRQTEDIVQKVPQAVPISQLKMCPKCGITMEIQKRRLAS